MPSLPSTTTAKPMKAKKSSGKFYARPKILSCPEGGWAAEMERVDKQAKMKTTSKTLLKKAAVSLKMRDFKKSKTSALLALSSAMNPTSKQKTELEAIVKNIGEEAPVWPLHDPINPFYEKLRKHFKTRGDGIDTNSCSFDTNSLFSNLNILQHAALNQNVKDLEVLISLGAAINMPALEKYVDVDTGLDDKAAHAAASRSSVLALCCMKIMTTSKQMGGNCVALVEVAIRLVRLGANIHDILNAPPENIDISLHKLWGKTAFDLAKMSKQTRLIDTMKHFDNLESVIDEVECRCGSRMPWVECHAGDGTTSFCRKDGTKLKWRYSPLAPCPCKNTSKQYYFCCWESPTEYFKDDTTGEVCRFANQSRLEVVRDAYSTLMTNRRESDPDIILLRMATRQFYKSIISDQKVTTAAMRMFDIQLIRSKGRPLLRLLASSTSQKSKIGEWDPAVYVGTMERLQNHHFAWEDIHWMIPKAELLERVDTWNDALDRYCNDLNLHGQERKAVVDLHTANPYAPCGNPNCDEMERNVKEFPSCKQCKSIAYCNRECQIAHWQVHKSDCSRI